MSKLSNIVTGKQPEPPRVVLYGTHGIGKSTFGASMPNPIFLQTEKGASNIDVAKFPISKTYIEARENLEALITEPHSYRTVVIDTLDWLERLIFAEVAGRAGVRDVGEIAYGKGHATAVSFWSEILLLLETLQEKRKMMVCLLAHSAVKRFDSPDSDSYDTISLDLHKNTGPMILEWADAVFYVAYQKVTSKVGEAFGKGVFKALGTGERIVYTQERPAFAAKNRYHLPHEMPFDFRVIGKAIFDDMKNGEKKSVPSQDEPEVTTAGVTSPLGEADDLPEGMR